MPSIITVAFLLLFTGAAFAQSGAGKQQQDAKRQTGRVEDKSEEEAAVLPYLNNFFTTARLGPEDVITVDVFAKPDYSRSNLTVPPDGHINYPLIGRLLVAGRTTTEIEKEITEKLSEYIIDPKVTVQIVQAHSQKVFIIGDVTQPGIYEMTRRMTVTEALARANYLTRYGDKEKIHILRMQPNGETLLLPLNMKKVEAGKAKDMYLAPGDTVVVPGNKFKTIEKVLSITTLAYWMRVIVR